MAASFFVLCVLFPVSGIASLAALRMDGGFFPKGIVPWVLSAIALWLAG